MKKINTFLALTFVLLSAISCKKEVTVETTTTESKDTIAKPSVQKIVSLNGAVTEIVAALGHEKELVGVDVTSTYPANVKTTAKDLGHVRSVNIEGIMALNPTLIIGTDKDMSPELLEKIKKSGVKAELFKQEFTPEGTKRLIADVAKVLDHKDFIQLNTKIDADLKNVKPLANAPKVLFIYARGANMMMVSGTGTPVDRVIALAGAKNAITDFEDFKPLTPEALIKGNPDVILLFDSGLESLGGAAGVLKIPGVDKTNAGKNKKIIAMDGGLLSGFGPRLGEAATQLNGLLSK
ncbi:ABC transporter substrate-binding protein [Flavobacterium rivuli WB 3.3-2 = DSM 21788]|uniref:ABC transporter substrate-binding protein n=1 Tax=Flavobacterium rivuli WB 3.3-2 = DSM 21788 TaxID=1121895 RepID=A0A0A2M267_9FLAO|nr:ABC transporter substrate-binding protein [Flavobacterium rivuli]KGO85661.1 ABC transporter substrate-binding protein [Flavobacterium rivuli WB 3.3-2 = DSM 21788]